MAFFAGALASALAGARRRGAEGEQEQYQRAQLDQRRQDSILQQELARAMQGRQQTFNEMSTWEGLQRQREAMTSAAEDRDLQREAMVQQRQSAAQEAMARAEADRQFREAEAQKQRDFTGSQNQLNRDNMRALREMTANQAPKPKAVPNTVAQGYLANQKQMSTIDAAIAGVESNPGALGWKAYIPGAILDRVKGQTGAGGVDARAGVADVGSLVVHDRSGAAVTVSEFPRLRPFIPLATDDSATALKKLRRMRAVLAEETQAMQDFYNEDQGYRGLPNSSPTAGVTPVKRPGRPGDVR